MENPRREIPNINKLGAVRRKAIIISQHELVKAEPLYLEKTLPLVIQPAVKRVDLETWASGNQDFIEAKLLQHGAILFRNFKVAEIAGFEQFISRVFGQPLEYRERSSPRSQVGGNIYTSTDYPADQSIFLHNENSYQDNWPLKIFFCCITPAKEGGETPIADCRRVFQCIKPEIRERFIEKKWMYVRNFGDGFGLPWQAVFQTTDKKAVEEHCRRNRIDVEWKDGDRLRTRAVRPAVEQHPLLGEQVWFNHATFFHVTTLEPTVSEALLAGLNKEDLPTNTYYGDGSPIEFAVLDELREAYRRETVAFPWQKGDILVLDNMLVAHGRAPYAGQRRIVVGMTEPCHRQKD